MHRRQKLVLALSVSIPLSACGGGPDVDGDDALQNVAAAVEKEHASAPWFEHVERVSGGLITDMKVHTDLEASDPAEMKMAIDVCNAYSNAIKTDDPYVLVYGKSTKTKTKIDGSKEEDVFENAKLARWADDKLGCIEAGILR